MLHFNIKWEILMDLNKNSVFNYLDNYSLLRVISLKVKLHLQVNLNMDRIFIKKKPFYHQVKLER